MGLGDITQSVLLKVSDLNAESWNQLAAQFDDCNLLQTWEWGEVKVRTAPWSVERIEFIAQDRVIGLAQVLVRRLPLLLGGMAWINRGPLWDRGAGPDLLGAILTKLHERYTLERGLYSRVAPTLPHGQLPALLEASPAFRDTGVPGHRGGRIDLTQSEPSLRASLRQNWRRFLVKAERYGTPVSIGQDDATSRRFLQVHGAILDSATYRKSTTPDLLEAFQLQLPPERRLLVLEAKVDGEPASWLVIATYGSIGEYLGAASLPQGRARNCGQLLTWTAMLHLKAQGYRVLDMGGFDPSDERSGVSHFKRGTNAVPYGLCSEIDAHPSPIRRNMIRSALSVGRIPLKLPRLLPGRLGAPAANAKARKRPA
jgi:hypothetical protein